MSLSTVSLRAKKTQRLQELFVEMQKCSIKAVPSHLLETYLTVNDDQFQNREIRVSMDNLDLVKVVIVYHRYHYDSTVADRRNAIKTARDIFDFYHDMQVGDYSKVSEELHGTILPKLSLYYQNSPSINSVLVTATMRYSFSEFIFNMDSMLADITSRLNQLTNLITKDCQGTGLHKRWEKVIPINKNWWTH